MAGPLAFPSDDGGRLDVQSGCRRSGISDRGLFGKRVFQELAIGFLPTTQIHPLARSSNTRTSEQPVFVQS
jgi:hypothetical protein